jgi:uncharacterized protein (TIGR02246 family)
MGLSETAISAKCLVAYSSGCSFTSLLKEEDMLERVQVTDVAQIYELCNEVAAAANEGNLARWISLWTDDGIQMPPGAARRVGKEQIRRELQLQLERLDFSNIVLQPEEVRILGNWAYAHGTYEFDRAPRHGGETRSYSAKFLAILEKQVDGSWKIAIDCYNYDTPTRIWSAYARERARS